MGLNNTLKKLMNWYHWRIQNRGKNTTSLFINGNIDKVEVGNYTYGRLNVFSYGSESEKLQIGSFCSIAGTSKFILGGEHDVSTFLTYPIKPKILQTGHARNKGSIVIEDDVWIGESAIIMSGVHVGRGAVIGAGAVVTKDIPPYAVAAGIPAKVIKYRFDYETIEKLMGIDFNRINKDEIENNLSLFEEKLNNCILTKLVEKYEKIDSGE